MRTFEIRNKTPPKKDILGSLEVLTGYLVMVWKWGY